MKIEIVGKFYDQHSLAIVNRYMAIELAKYAEVFITPVDMYDPEHKLDRNIVKQIKKLEIKETEVPDIQLRHTYPPIFRWPTNKKTKVVYICPWEFVKIPMEWQMKWETFADAVITPSKWTADKFMEAGLNPSECFVVPNGYDPKIFNRNKEDNLGFVDNKKFTYTFVGNGQYRKGLDILLDAWGKAFVKADNVQLLIKDSPQIYGSNNVLDETIRLQHRTGCGTIIYNDSVLTDKEIANLYKQTDIIIHPYRGEGFGMHLQEAMACGAYPLVTFGGACNDFINESCGMFLNTTQKFIDLTEKKVFAIKPGDSLTGMGSHGSIIEPNAEDVKSKMQLLYFHHERNRVLAGIDNAKLSTWETVGNQYYQVLERINTHEQQPKRFGCGRNYKESIKSNETPGTGGTAEKTGTGG